MPAFFAACAQIGQRMLSAAIHEYATSSIYLSLSASFSCRSASRARSSHA
jgi:hypothetical protein